MNFLRVLAQDEEIIKKIELFKDKVIDGHAPNITEKELQAYVAAEINTDHKMGVCNGIRSICNS